MSTPSDADLPLAAEFPPATREQWRALVEGVLKGASFEDRLVARTRDGIRIEPLYADLRTARPSLVRATPGPWQILQRVDDPDPARANAEALHDLENGATGLTFACAGGIGAHGFGITPERAALERMLDGVHLDAGIAIEVDGAGHAEDVATAVASLVEQHGVAPASVVIRFGFDPIGAMAARGGAPLPWPQTATALAKSVEELTRRGLRGPFAVADGRPVHAAGGSEAQELAFALASAVAYLRAFEAHGIALEDARRMIFFRLAADADQFLTTAKFRALRLLWARVEAACGLAPVQAFVSAETAWRMLTRRDPHVNILRTAIATLAAGVGGADAITVLPFTAALGLPERFARRIARNMQLILIEEASLARIADPAAGAGAFEALTEDLCRTAWTLFQDVEAAGGAYAALEKEMIQSKVSATRAARADDVAHRREPITGTSEFPHLVEAPVAILDVPPIAAREPAVTIACEPLRPSRLAEPFEALRDAADRVLAATGARPRAFLATLGTPADFTPRATFARNLFEAGGIEASVGDGFADHSAMIAALKSSGAKIACLCGSDVAYAQDGPAAARALAEAGVAHLLLVGRPNAVPDADRGMIAAFLYAGCDAVAILTSAHRALGIV